MKHKCDKCDRPAVHHSVDIIKGQKIEKHLCHEHAMDDPDMMEPGGDTPIHELLTTFLKMHGGNPVQEELACEICGLTCSEFREKSLLGCPECYRHMEPVLGPLLERAHQGGTHHLGKAPRRCGDSDQRQMQLSRLRKRIDEAVAAEDYELAADLRDEISQFEESASP